MRTSRVLQCDFGEGECLEPTVRRYVLVLGAQFSVQTLAFELQELRHETVVRLHDRTARLDVSQCAARTVDSLRGGTEDAEIRDDDHSGSRVARRTLHRNVLA